MKAIFINEGFETEESRKLDSITTMLGYSDFAEFIGDNPGCMEVIIDWIDYHFHKKIADEMLDDPEHLENIGLYRSAEEIREKDSDIEEFEE